MGTGWRQSHYVRRHSPLAGTDQFKVESDTKASVSSTRGKPQCGARIALMCPEGEILRTFTILTVPANPEVAELHDRMPLIVKEREWPVWLGEVEGDPAGLLRPSPGEPSSVGQLHRPVNSPNDNGPELLNPAWSPGAPCSWFVLRAHLLPIPANRASGDRVLTLACSIRRLRPLPLEVRCPCRVVHLPSTDGQ